MSDALLDDTNRFLVSHIQSTDDLEIAKLKNLLEVQKAEQKELDAKVNLKWVHHKVVIINNAS